MFNNFTNYSTKYIFTNSSTSSLKPTPKNNITTIPAGYNTITPTLGFDENTLPKVVKQIRPPPGFEHFTAENELRTARPSPPGFYGNNFQDDLISLPGYQPISPSNNLMSLFNTISLDDDGFSSL